MVNQGPEQVNHPEHYGGDKPYEVIKVLEAWGLNENARLWNAVKYIARAGKKGDVLTDLRKANWYLEREIAAIAKAQAKAEQAAGTDLREERREAFVGLPPKPPLDDGTKW